MLALPRGPQPKICQLPSNVVDSQHLDAPLMEESHVVKP